MSRARDLADSADLSFDGSTLSIDSTNNRVGIGTTSPLNELDVNGSIRISQDGGVIGNGDEKIKFDETGQTIQFQTADSEAMRIHSDQSVLFKRGGRPAGGFENEGFKINFNGQINPSVDDDYTAYFNRLSTDGSIINLAQGTNTEGTISVSGTTVSYNGGHLARWSRLADESKDTSIVKGTVMTNLDAMVEWGDEDNEQLNKMAVSSVEGDANVAGVFVNWDVEDDWNDMNIAMTGDMVIRIASGTTVARGDLLMSAGDGTAKPQGDDIVRSKTIAKVTSTHVSHTYDDGSYLVPCVLMAC